MEETQGYCTIDQLVRDECLAQNDLNLSHYLRFLSFALEGLRDWSLDKGSDLKVVLLQTSKIATLPFPADYVKWSRIGTVEGDRIKGFVINNKLALSHQLDDCGQPINNSPYKPKFTLPGVSVGISGFPSIFGSPFYFLNLDTSGAINGFGNGGYLNDGQFRVDEANRRFQFSSHYTDKPVYLEYAGTGLNPTGQTVVSENARKAIKLYIRWQAAETNKNESMNAKMRAEEQYWKENLTATKRITVDLDKILAVSRQAYKTTPKS